MDGSEPSGGDRTFRANFTGGGVERLKENVKAKLMELMGDYTDDALVEYVVVLLRNGRCKDGARKELNVFLGDETVPFVSWLWDHLSSNLHLYFERKASFADDLAKTNSLMNKRYGSQDSRPQHLRGRKQNALQYEKQDLAKLSRNRHNREWRGLVQEEMQQVFLQSTLNENHLADKTHQRTNLVVRSRSPALQAHKKRSRHDKVQPAKRISRPSVGPPSRLLQFALRDALSTVQQISSRTEPALKRLRSTVSTPSADCFLVDRSQMTIPVSGAAARVINAAAEAAEDVLKVTCPENDMNTTETLGHSSNSKEDILAEEEFNDIFQIPGPDYLYCYERSEYDGELMDDFTMLDGETEISNNDGYDLMGSLRHQSYLSSTENKDPFMLQYSVSKDTDGVKQARFGDQEPLATVASNASRKVVNISVKVNTWKPPRYASSRNPAEVKSLSAGVKGNLRTGKPNVQLSNTAIPEKDNEVVAADVDEFQKTVPSTPGSYSASRPCDDADSRIIFVSNVHFAATKDALSHHFIKFGEVLKVIIETDVRNGQPKGSAFIEFMQKESAEQALSLNGTYFMTRVLKVIKSNGACHEGASLVVRPRVARTSLLAPMLRRAAFPRAGISNMSRGALPSSFRAPLLVKPTARSLQWKRDTSSAQPGEGVKSQQKPSLPPRLFTYVRSISKPDSGSAG